MKRTEVCIVAQRDQVLEAQSTAGVKVSEVDVQRKIPTHLKFFCT